MDFILELLLQLVVQFIVEVIWELLIDTALRRLAQAMVTRIGRGVLGAAVGCGFGYAWGEHLSGGEHWPKLLWVSIGLAITACVLAVGRAGAQPQYLPSGQRLRDTRREVFAPPWRWPAHRLVSFAVLNLGIAAGIGVGFDAARVLR